MDGRQEMQSTESVGRGVLIPGTPARRHKRSVLGETALVSWKGAGGEFTVVKRLAATDPEAEKKRKAKKKKKDRNGNDFSLQ